MPSQAAFFSALQPSAFFSLQQPALGMLAPEGSVTEVLLVDLQAATRPTRAMAKTRFFMRIAFCGGCRVAESSRELRGQPPSNAIRVDCTPKPGEQEVARV